VQRVTTSRLVLFTDGEPCLYDLLGQRPHKHLVTHISTEGGQYLSDSLCVDKKAPFHPMNGRGDFKNGQPRRADNVGDEAFSKEGVNSSCPDLGEVALKKDGSI